MIARIPTLSFFANEFVVECIEIGSLESSQFRACVRNKKRYITFPVEVNLITLSYQLIDTQYIERYKRYVAHKHLLGR